MTYCLAMRMRDGLVFLSDTRTNAGVDNVGKLRNKTVAIDVLVRATRTPQKRG
jgi:predicted proteasome-type protease